MTPRHALPALALALTLVACTTAPRPNGPGVASPKPKASPGLAGRSPAPGDAKPKAGVLLAGVARILSDNGAGIVSDHGGGIISDHGGGIISNNTGGLVSKAKYAVAQAGTPQLAEFLLADAIVTLQDAKGQPVLGADGKPLQATTDATGRYELRAELPATSLVAKIQLKQGGELAAMLPRDAIAAALTGGTASAAALPLDLDTSTSVGAAYVLDQFVKGDQTVFDRLPGAETSRLARELTNARTLLDEKPDYSATGLVGLATELRGKSKAVDQTFEDIKIILLGQADLGGGRPATEVALGQPQGLALTAKGDLLVAEGDGFLGRIRRIDRAGLLTTFVDSSYGDVKANYPQINDIATAPDGTVYVAEGRTARVYRITPDGKSGPIAGTGVEGKGPVDVIAEQGALYPSRIEVAPDGTLFIGDGKEAVSPEDGETRLLFIDKAGMLRRQPITPNWADGQIDGFAIRPDGSFDVLHRPYDGKFKGTVYHLKPDGSWTETAKDLPIGRAGDLARGPDGALYVVEQTPKRIERIAADGTRTIVAGAGAPAGRDLTYPSSAAVGADGTLYASDESTGLVHALAPDGTWKTLAGRKAGTQTGSYDAISISAPGGLAFDAQGRLLFADGGSHTIRRLDADGLTVVAGSTRGRGGDGGPATAAQLDGPTAVAVKDGELWIMDSDNSSLRKVDAAGKIALVVGSQKSSSLDDWEPGETRKWDETRIGSGVDFTFDKDGQPIWIDVDARQVMRLRADGVVEQVVGKADEKAPFLIWAGDGAKPLEVSLDLPSALMFDKAGDLLVCDPLAMAIRKVKGFGTPASTIETWAGVPPLESIRRLNEEPGRSEEGVDVKDATMLGPAGMCYDGAGNLYLAETGTTKVGVIAASLNGQPIDTSFLPPSSPRIRKITPEGKVYTVAGPGGKLLPDPNAPDALVTPWRLAIDPQGRLVVVDVGANQLRFFPKGSY